ncbi:hypothetical protein [Elizabethkingia meningoseptica]|uniref:hypothetical protein n=1 Tax=Elizabethkingia meningoseptica TaxID=238 RepID=UPI0038920780
MAETNSYFRGLFKSPLFRIIFYKLIPILILFWTLLRTFYPYVFFIKKHSIILSNIEYTFYSNEKLNTDTLEKLTYSVQNKISTSSLFKDFSDKERSVKLFVCNSPVLYTFLVPFNRKGFATSSKLTNNIFLSNVNLNTGYSSTFPENKKIKNDNLIAHEISHLMLYNSNIDLKGWIEEGYCEYVAYGSNVDVKRMLEKSEKDKYIKYMLGVDFLLKQNNDDLKKLENMAIENNLILNQIKK